MAPPKAPRTTPEMALLGRLKTALLELLKTVLEMALLNRLNGVAKVLEWRLNDVEMTLENSTCNIVWNSL